MFLFLFSYNTQQAFGSISSIFQGKQRLPINEDFMGAISSQVWEDDEANNESMYYHSILLIFHCIK